MLCDSHLHFIPQQIAEHTSFYRGVWTDKQKLLGFLDTNKIDQALLVYPATDAHLKLGWPKLCEFYNRDLAALIKEDHRIVGCGIVDLADEVSSQAKRLKEEGFRGVSIVSSQDGKFILDKLQPLFAAAAKYNLAIFVHPQTINPIGFERVKDPLLMPVLEYSFDNSMFMGLLMMEGILDKYALKFIFASLGGVIPFLKERFDRVYTMLRSRQMVKDLGKMPSEIFKNAYVDCAGASLETIELAIDLFGEDKLLWGSDYPVCGEISTSLKMLDELGSEVKEKIIRKNFQTIFAR